MKRVRHDYKAELLQQMSLAGLPMPTPEHQFAKPRRWRFDWAYINEKIAIEYQGGVYYGMGHQTVKGFENDCRKFSEANILGWTLILVTAGMVRTGEALGLIERALK